MTYTLLRVDYNPGGTCDKCHRPLTSPKTVIAKDAQNNICYLGAKCAESATNSIKDIPNLTRDFSKQGQTNSNSQGSPNGNQEQNLSQALAYLHLRQKSLAHFEHKSIAYDPFKNLLENYYQGDFSEDDARYVINVMRKNQRERPFLGLANLKNLYLFDFLLTKAISKVSKTKKDFLDNIQTKSLRKNAYLTDKQIKAACNWFEYIDGVEKADIEKITLIKS